MSLVSSSDLSGLRSLVQAAVRFKVSLCAQKFFALHHNQALFIALSAQAQISSLILIFILLVLLLHPAPTIVFMQHVTLSGTLHHWGFTLFYSLVCLVRPAQAQTPRVFFFFSFSLTPFISLFPSNSLIFTTFEHHCKFVYIVVCWDSPRLLCSGAIRVVIYKLYIWRIASHQLCDTDLTDIRPSFFSPSQPKSSTSSQVSGL